MPKLGYFWNGENRETLKVFHTEMLVMNCPRKIAPRPRAPDSRHLNRDPLADLERTLIHLELARSGIPHTKSWKYNDTGGDCRVKGRQTASLGPG